MGKITGFLEYNRALPGKLQPEERIKNYKEFYQEFSDEETNAQAARCMDCGIPFCHSGCPLGNNIPDFNDAVYKQNWKQALEILSKTNPFPEFTGRICPAPCEGSCVLGLNNESVAIEHIEKSIAEKGFELGLIKAEVPAERTGKSVAVIGSGPAGLAVAHWMNKYGHSVTVFERDDRIGGLLRYGIPDFKLEKWTVERRVQLMMDAGIEFVTNAEVGKSVSAKKLADDFDAIVICTGSTVPRDLDIPGRHLKGVHKAMDYLKQSNKRVAGDQLAAEDEILVEGKHVCIIGAGDTASDCIGTSNRLKAATISQLYRRQQPPKERQENNPWPEQPKVFVESTSQQEGCGFQWSVVPKAFIGNEAGELTHIQTVTVEWVEENGRLKMIELEGTEEKVPCDVALLAIGYAHPEHDNVVEELKLQLDKWGNIKSTGFATNESKVFAAGDARIGQSLVVTALAEGRQVSKAVHQFLGFNI
ncbi:glutamate synthase subunit beta [Persicobacter psychrovividus]|uniref:Dihydropyrimidine dehydrogenase subunit A n=1 Tax=Persicobacter psychrovividus TaxID=387638 RepID=A0ABM7VLC8_9BACT|nr:dihydropyrimidine dehydrogenase subunit A [Persicobacter psychrovividus]